MQNPHGFIMQSPKKPCGNFCLIFAASLLLEIHSSPPPSVPIQQSLFLPVYSLPFPLYTTFVAIHLVKFLRSSTAFGNPVCLWEHLLTSNYWSCHVRESSVWCGVFYCLCWGQWANISSGADIHSWTNYALFSKFQLLKATSVLLQNNS